MQNSPYLIADGPRIVTENSCPTVQSWWRLTQPSSLLLYPGLRVLDFVCGPVVLALVLMAGNSHRMPSGLTSFLSIRVTVKNLGLMAAFVVIWWLTFAASNLYQNSKLRSIRADFAAVLRACSVGTFGAVVFSRSEEHT